MFPQEHRPGEAGQSDFTDMSGAGGDDRRRAVRSPALPLRAAVLELGAGDVCFSESFESLVSGLQGAIWEMGRVPKKHRTDNLSAATHELKDGGRSFNERYKAVLDHYGVDGGPQHAGPRPRERRRRAEPPPVQAGPRAGAAAAGRPRLRQPREYEVFLRKVIDGRNRGPWEKYAEELAVMGPLPLTRLSELPDGEGRRERLLDDPRGQQRLLGALPADRRAGRGAAATPRRSRSSTPASGSARWSGSVARATPGSTTGT